jgi:diguanylate cyclase (GGDEF)-like protein
VKLNGNNDSPIQTVLICDEDPALRKSVYASLKNEQVNVIEASNGQQALEQFFKYLPDVVILNNELSVVNSFEVCRHIHTTTAAPNTPVMMLTSDYDTSTIQRINDCGAADFLLKPIDLPILAHRLKQMLLTHRVMQQTEDKLNYLSQHDALTGLVNRQSFTKQLERSLTKARKNPNQAAVLLIDIDNFKRINDTLGHNYGDALLQKLSRRLNMSLRSTDLLMHGIDDTTATPPKLARLGGDEFTIYIEDIRSVNAVITIAKRIIKSISLPVYISGREVAVTPSIGIALYPHDGGDVNTLLKNAERAMYVAKKNGGNCFKLYNDEMDAAAKKRLKLESDLRHAIEGEQLQLHYQPQIDTETGKVSCLEALIRWDHPELGMIGPNEFIPIAEETGLIIPIGDWVLQSACAQAKSWLAQGLPLSRIAVNVSAFQFHRADFFDKVVNTLCECDLSAQHLELELTESIIMSNADENIDKLQRLKTIGVSLAVDDFGTGYSSLSYLKDFPVDTLKVDRSFIASIAKDSKNAAIVCAIIAMAEQLQLKVVAEGVENMAQVNFLSKNNCTLLQGFYYSKPKPVKEISRLIGQKIKNNSMPIPIFEASIRA